MKNIKLLIVLLSVLLVSLSGCGQQSDGKPWAVKEICVKGVTYYRTGYALAPAYNEDGTLITCWQKAN